MKAAAAPFVLGASLLLLLLLLPSASSFSPFASRALRLPRSSMSASEDIDAPEPPRHPHCDLPGDPSLVLTTNVDLGDDKEKVLKELSSVVASSLSKPESYVAVSVTDKASMIFGGSTAPLALGCVYSLGSINKANNGALTKGVTDVLEKYGVDEGRMYISFFDVPRENMGWKRATFAG